MYAWKSCSGVDVVSRPDGRGREKSLLSKLDLALKKIEDGTFGICEICEEPIGKKRLEARPETTLCIKCKEDQEREERTMG